MEKNKLIIIGGGPAGLSASIYASRADLNPIVIEGNPPGGQLTQTSEIENYPGFPNGILGPALISNFRKQAERFGTKFITKNVISITSNNNSLKITLEDKEVINAEAILIATGASAKWLGLESETRLKGKGVSGCATCDGFFFRDKDVIVVGGGDTAMEDTLFLTKFAKSVTVIHRRDQFRASKVMQERVITNPKVKILWNSEIVEILGDQKVSGVKIKRNIDNNFVEEEINTDGVFVAIGHSPSTSFLKDSGVELDNNGYILTTDRILFEKLSTNNNFLEKYRYSTSIPGIFAAGDCIDPTYRQATTAVGMGVAAELEIEKYLQEKLN